MRHALKVASTIVVVVALTMTGIALAQSSDTPVTDVAPDGGRLQAAILERLLPLIEDGTISEGQAEAVASHLADTVTDRRHRRPGFAIIGVTLEFLGVTPEEAREALGAGQTLADIAEANGSSGEELVEFLLDRLEAHLDEAVADGNLTDERRAEILESAEERVTALVDGEIDLPRPHDRRRPHLRGPVRHHDGA